MEGGGHTLSDVLPLAVCKSSPLIYCVCVLRHKHTKHKHTEGANCRVINVQATGTYSYHYSSIR